MMLDALRRAGKSPELLMTKDKEGHGCGKIENRGDIYTQKLVYLCKHIGLASNNK